MAFDAYMEVDGIKGEATDDKHKDWIALTSYSIGVSQPTTGAGAGQGGLVSGRANPQQLQVTKLIDKSSPALALACCEGKALKTVKLQVCEHAGQQHTFAQVNLSDAIVASVKTEGSNGHQTERPQETISFAYSKIEWVYTPIGADHKAGSDTKSGYDFKANKKV